MNSRTTPEYRLSSPTGEVARTLLREYFREILERYHEGAIPESDVDAILADHPDTDLTAPTGALLIGYVGDEPVAISAMRELEPGTTELTRIFTRPQWRGRGIGRQNVEIAEARATADGYTRVRMSTRADLIEARRLYARLGYTEIERYNDDEYADHFFEKALTPGAPIA